MNPVRSHSHAFSLIELLVVIGLIAIMAAAGAMALGGRGGKSLNGSAAVAASMFGLARTEAIMRGTTTHLEVDSAYDAAKPDSYLRRMRVVVSTNGGMTYDYPVAKWTTLPGNAFFNAGLSKSHGTNPTFYEFQPNGQATTRAWFVISAGTVDSGGVFHPKEANALYGFVLQKMGKPTFFSDPGEIRAINSQ